MIDNFQLYCLLGAALLVFILEVAGVLDDHE